MVDNQGNYYGVAPDKGTRNGPVLTSNHATTNIEGSEATTGTYWLGSITHGEMPYAPSGYPFFRNVMSYGAKGDGKTDDTAAINLAATNGTRCGQACGSSSILGAMVYFPVYSLAQEFVLMYLTLEITS